jgi:hypothetical protein
MEERGGVLLRLGDGDDALGFVPAAVARRLTSLSSLTPVPGTRPPVAGIALADGTVVTVLRIGRGDAGGVGVRGSRSSVAPVAPGPAGATAAPASRPVYQPGEDWLVPGSNRAVLCHLGGFEVALTGATVVATGVFDAAPVGEGVVWRNASVPLLDVRALYAQAEAATWAGRAAASGPRAPMSQRPSPRPSQPVFVAAVDVEEEEELGRQAILPGAPDGEGGGST